MKWVLIFYLVGRQAQSGGGPGVAEFGNELACERAALALSKKWGRNYEGHVCVEWKVDK